MTETAGSVKPKLRLRIADSVGDLERLRPIVTELHAESHFADIPYSHKKADDLFWYALKHRSTHALIIAELGEAPVGFIFCAASEFVVGYGELITTVHTFCVAKHYRGTVLGGKAAMRLFYGVIRWSKARQSKQILVHVTSGIAIKRTDTFLRRIGFRVIGANYAFYIDQFIEKDMGVK